MNASRLRATARAVRACSTSKSTSRATLARVPWLAVGKGGSTYRQPCLRRDCRHRAAKRAEVCDDLVARLDPKKLDHRTGDRRSPA